MDVADRAVVQTLDRFAKSGVVAKAETGDDRKFFAFCFGTRFQHGSHAGSIDRDGLFGKDVFARLDGRFQMDRSKVRRSRQQDDVDVGGQDCL